MEARIVYMTEVKAKPGKAQDILRASLEVAKAANAQEGCIDYRILQSPNEPTITMNLEIWSSDAARDTFNAGSDVERFIHAVSGAFAQPPHPISYHEISL